MVSRVEDLAPPRVSRSTRLEVVRQLAERDARAAAQDELKQARAGLMDEARRVARQEAVASMDELAASPLSWSMVLLALLASAALALSTTLTGLTGGAVVALALVVLSILYAARS